MKVAKIYYFPSAASSKSSTIAKINKMHKAFSLIELLIVIFIISLVYFLGFENLEMPENKPKALTPLNLKSNITNSEMFSGKATMLCVNKCTKCYLRKGINASFSSYGHGIDLKDTKAYTLDNTDSIVEIEYGRYKDEKICLVIDFYRNGSSTQIILENKSGVYFLPSFFRKAQKVESLADAKELWLKYNATVSDSGSYY